MGPLATLARPFRVAPLIALVVVGVSSCQPTPAELPPHDGPVRLEEVTARAGLEVSSQTFGATFSDLDADGDDDLVVSFHGSGPRLYLNQGGLRFTDATALLPRSVGDRHGVAAADLDGDGDRDLVMACGGADGKGPGSRTYAFRSRLAQSGELGFDDVSAASGLADASQYRGRTFLMLPGTGGAAVDLYLTAKSREGFPNRLYRNRGDGTFTFDAVDVPGITESFDCEGMDAAVDLDRDGRVDLLLASGGQLLHLRQTPDGFQQVNTVPEIKRVVSVTVGDLDNDGWADVYVGTRSRFAPSDLVAASDQRLHFEVYPSAGDPADEVGFTTRGDRLQVSMKAKPGLAPDDPSDIFVGRAARNPASRAFAVDRREASGEPAVERSGTYLWFDPGSGRWHLRFVHPEKRSGETRGWVKASGLGEVETEGLELFPAEPTADVLLHNDRGQLTPWPDPPDLTHTAVTAAAVMVDLDNDGWLDVVVTRRLETGTFNATPLLVRNRGSGRLEAGRLPDLERPQDALYLSDQLAVADVDDDGLQDLFLTNGWGLLPGNTGPVRLFRNVTEGAGPAVVLDLAGLGSNRDAIGAQVELYGGSRLAPRRLGYRELGAGFNRSQSSRLLHFGLGSYTGPLRARIRWPGGAVSEHVVTPGRQRLEEPGGP